MATTKYTISPGDLEETVQSVLSLYADEIIEAEKKEAKNAIDLVQQEVKENYPFYSRTGKYVKAMATKKTASTSTGDTYTWYVKSPYHRLTHLLENGHATRNGGRTKAYPHIGPAAEKGVKYFTEKMEEAIKRGNS